MFTSPKKKKVILKRGLGRLLQSVKSLPQKSEDLRFSPRIYMKKKKKKLCMLTHASNPRARDREWKQVDPWGWLASQPSLLCKLCKCQAKEETLSQKTSWVTLKEQFLKSPPDLCIPHPRPPQKHGRERRRRYLRSSGNGSSHIELYWENLKGTLWRESGPLCLWVRWCDFSDLVDSSHCILGLTLKAKDTVSECIDQHDFSF